ncbi:bifunctional diguanylate cyclase/phosphodiesterase [Cyanobium sp. FACHB-13342]|nr:bifunctional diguanylate cyclase/phosphodiesterase [Cyanobium sp. FACHB-13342]
MRPLLPAVPKPLQSWWKQERQDAPRSARQRRMLLLLVVLTGLLIALLARHLGKELLLLALLLAGLLVSRIILMLDRRRQLLVQARQERRTAGRIRQTSRDLDAMLQQLGMQPDSFERGEIKFKMSQLTSRMEWLLQSARSLALLDALTQLPNRRHFIEQVQIELARAKRGRKRFAVLFIDVDKFKAINDTYGHATGDRALMAVSQRLKTTIRAGDFLSRLGGDEFAVLMDLSAIQNPSEQTLKAHAHLFACRIMAMFEELADLGSVSIDISISIGVSVVDPDSSDPEAILRQSDVAMDLAKHQQHARVAVFDVATTKGSYDDYQLYADLRDAVRSGGLSMAFQPVVDGEQGLRGVEALARWHHPSRGFIAPDVFITMAERYRMMRELGDYLFQASLDGFLELRQALSNPALRLSTNISPSQLGDPQLQVRLLGMLERSGVDPALVTLEITEVSILERTTTSEANLQALRQAGIELSLDDFGTGYSSLNLINTLQPNEIKIDRSFVLALHDDPYARQIVEVIAGMSTQMALHLVAEGVEDEATFRVLRELGIQYFQGYWFSKPLPVADLAARYGAAPKPTSP